MIQAMIDELIQIGPAYIFGYAIIFGPILLIIYIIEKKTSKKCKYCKEEINKNATKCPHCQSDLTREDK